jgi:hypothetical protein
MGPLRGAAYGGRQPTCLFNEEHALSPIAAYYIFMVMEHERAAAAAHGLPPHRRPSLVDRVRTLTATVRPQGSPARSARTA